MTSIAAGVIERVKQLPWASKLVLGGGLALAHYMEYRTTNDADCWWDENVTKEEKETILKELKDVIRREAANHVKAPSVALRSWGDTESIEVKDGNKKVFSWQISSRTKRLENYTQSPYGNLKIETFTDNIASKMCALVARGTPRDFLDIYTAIQRNLVTWEECWTLWEKKNPSIEKSKAQYNIAISIAGIEARRPLSSFPIDQRASAEKLREFFKSHLPNIQ